MAERQQLAATKAERMVQYEEKLGDLALNADSEAVQMQACVHAMDRIEGKPAQTVRNLNVNVSVKSPVDLDALTDEQRDVLDDILLLSHGAAVTLDAETTGGE